MVSPKAEGAVKPQMHPQVQIIGKAAEELLPLSEGMFKVVPIDPLGVRSEPALRRSNGNHLPAKDIVKLTGKSVKGMSFWHG